MSQLLQAPSCLRGLFRFLGAEVFHSFGRGDFEVCWPYDNHLFNACSREADAHEQRILSMIWCSPRCSEFSAW
jgi:hypothetical protein